MNPDDVPWLEPDRLAALRSYNVVESDEDFADIVSVAATVCKAPIAAVNFIEEQRQWFGAEIGLGVRETPLDISICARAILQQDLFIVPDLTLDQRFNCNPLVVGDPKLRFYGGALIKTDAGLPLGTVCVLDYEPRPMGLTTDQATVLRTLARQVMTQLQLRMLVSEKELLIKEAHHRVTNSLQRVQSLLSIQAGRAGNKEPSGVLNDAARRIQVFADMHRHLYAESSGTHLDLRAYLARLIESENAGASLGSGERVVELVGAPVQWPALDAPNLGLVTLELITNALKYGKGRVAVTLSDTGSHIEISVEDEGRGLPESLESATGTGLGMLIANGLLEANDGQLIVERSRGHTCFIARSAKPGR